MKKFEEEMKEWFGSPTGFNMEFQSGYEAYSALVKRFKGYISPEDHQAKVDELNKKIDWLHGLLDERNEEVLTTVKLLNEAQPKIPEVPQFVADWYEENKGSLDYMIFETCRDLTDESTDEFEKWFGYDNNKAITTLVNMKNGYTVAKEKRFYLKNKLTKKFLAVRTGHEVERVKIGEYQEVRNLSPKNEGLFKVVFTQQEIDSMETGSYEQVEVVE